MGIGAPMGGPWGVPLFSLRINRDLSCPIPPSWRLISNFLHPRQYGRHTVPGVGATCGSRATPTPTRLARPHTHPRLLHGYVYFVPV